MASYTTNLDLKKPAQSDKIRIADINGNMDDIDAAFGAIGDTSVATQVSDIRAGMAIVSVSNTHAAIASGEYVYVTEHATLDDGLYVATAAIAANGTLSSSNLTAVSKGGLNALNDQIATSNIDTHLSKSSNTAVTDFSKNVRKSSNIINFNCDFKFTGRFGTVAVFDSGYRPSILNYVTCAYLKGGYQYPAYATIQTNGEIFILLPESITADYVYIGGTFIV